MKTYFDSALLVKAYCLEATSPEAIALRVGAKEFVSFDRRQRAVAERTGLEIPPAISAETAVQASIAFDVKRAAQS